MTGPDPALEVTVPAHARYWGTRFIEFLGDDLHAAWTVAREAVFFYEVTGDRRMLVCSQVEVGECARRLYSVAERVTIIGSLAEELREPVITSFVLQYLAVVLAEHGDANELRRRARWRCG